ncbi:endonuclease [Caerostris darwini]|uniref:Endonuclease n=1 Tax=Caerostris darwini TaxID=1538125 RepID=A0AAV4MQI1_9ARAC|nr:endonuclease [Caerostris darwini]
MENLLKHKRIVKDNEFDKYEQEMHKLFSKLDSLKITLKDELKKLRKNDNSSNACQSKVNTNGKLDSETLRAWILEQAGKKLSSFAEFKGHILNHALALESLTKCRKENPDVSSDVRRNIYKKIQDFRLTRIAYGTASAPYLAVKCLQQLDIQEEQNFPLASKAAVKDFYVDDLMSEANSTTEALDLQAQLIQMLSSAGLVLRKWASNCNELTNLIQEDLRLPKASLSIDDDTVKTLGILWHPASDVFSFKVNSLSLEGTLTKRTLLSTISKTFDPLGWLSPITIQSKLLMQKLWKYQLQWDEVVPPDIAIEWKTLSKDILFVKDFKISRYLFLDPDNQFQLHGFSDASEKAYAAVIYCRSMSNTGQIKVQLVIAKTKVAPLKTISLPRLELYGALLLSKLMDFTCKAFDIPISQSHFHTDSTIVLAWIGSHASRWKTFVANRVAKIRTWSSPTQWHQVSGNENLADLATRGVSFSALLTSVWLCGPEFLYNECSFHPESSVPTLNDSVSTLNEKKGVKKGVVYNQLLQPIIYQIQMIYFRNIHLFPN